MAGMVANKAKAAKKHNAGKNLPRTLPDVTELSPKPFGKTPKNSLSSGFVEDFMVEAVINLELFILGGQLRMEKQCFFFGNDEILTRLQNKGGNRDAFGEDRSLPHLQNHLPVKAQADLVKNKRVFGIVSQRFFVVSQLGRIDGAFLDEVGQKI